MVEKAPTHWWSWWPLVLGPCAMVAVYVAHAAGGDIFIGRYYQEPAAIGLSITALCVSLCHLAVARHPYHLLLSSVALAVVLREFHWDWTTKFVYVAIGLIAAWGLLWWKRLAPYLDEHARVRVWLFCTAAMYVLSVVIARRVFRGVLPMEPELHIQLEEVTENVSHGMLIVAALVGPWRSRPGAGAMSDGAPAITVRSPRAEDAAAIAGLLGELGYPTDDVEGLAASLPVTPFVVRVAVADGRVVGMASLHVFPLIHDARPLGRISSMVVTDAWRGRGVGRALVQTLEAAAREAGCERIEVTSRLTRTDAHAFYERMGYEHASRRFLKRV